jgi:CBS domain-containing protein
MRLPPGAKKLPIRTHRKLEPDGLRTFDERVYCEFRERSVPVDECIGCSHCTYVTFSSSDGSYLVCDRPSATAATEVGETVGTAMCRIVQCVRPETTVDAVAALLLECSIGGAPVIDVEGRAIGMVSKTDLVRCLHEGRDPKSTTVEAIMMPMVFALFEDVPLDRAAALMAYEGIHRIPVVATDGVLVGVVTPLDIARVYGRSASGAIGSSARDARGDGVTEA